MSDSMPARSPDTVYDLLLLWWRTIASIFFREIRPRGAYNLPRHGPVILVAAPHNNQFLDSLLLMSEVHRETQRRVENIIAAKSMKMKSIGIPASLMSSIPVVRAADGAKSGTGFIFLSDNDPCLVLGYGTRFTTELRNGWQIMLPKSLDSMLAEVTEVISVSEVRIKGQFGEADGNGTARFRDEVAQGKTNGTEGVNYKCLPNIDQQEMYKFVYQRLKEDACIGIFPEGGSHDRTDLLPLKAGAAIMALGAMANDPSTKVKIVPVGLSYFHAHRFRSRAVIEFGSPMDVPSELVDMFAHGGIQKREACSQLLDTICKGLKTVTQQAPDYDTLMVIQAARRLYQTPGQHLTLSRVVEMNKRFLEAYDRYKDEPRVKKLRQDVSNYNRAIRNLGLRDHQVPRAKPASRHTLGLLGYRLGLLLFWSILALPGIILNGPIFVLASVISKRKAKEALASSTVKIAGKDVLGSWKVLISLLVAPILYALYAILATLVVVKTNMPLRWRILAPFLTVIILPLMSYAALKCGEAGVDILKSLRPLVIALLPGQQESLDRLKRMREELSDQLTELINELAPKLWDDFAKWRDHVSGTERTSLSQDNPALHRRKGGAATTES